MFSPSSTPGLDPQSADATGPNRPFRLLLILFLGECALLIFLTLGTHGLIVAGVKPQASDYVSFQAAGLLARQGTPERAYDPAVHYATEVALTEPGIDPQYFFYPPPFLLLMAPLSYLPYLVSLYGFEAATLALFLIAICPPRAQRRGYWWLPALAFPASFWTVGLAQNSFLTASLFAGGLRLLQRRPALAGVLFGLLCYKPQLGLLLPVAFVASKRWRTFGAAALTVGGAVGLSMAAFGVSTWQAFFAHARSESALYWNGTIDPGGIVSPLLALRTIGLSPLIATGLALAVAVVAALAVWRTWRIPLPAASPAQEAVLLSGSLLAAPMFLLYDLLPDALAIMALARARPPAAWRPWHRIVAGAAFLLPLCCRGLTHLTGLQVMPVVNAAILVWAVRESFATRAHAPR